MTDFMDIKTHFDISEDPAPNETLGGELESVDRPEIQDPTETPEFDTGPDAYQALLDFEAEAGADPSLEAATLPNVSWASDQTQPDFAHSLTAAAAELSVPSRFAFSKQVLDLLIKANRFKPRGKNDLIAFGLRGGKLVGDDTQEGQSSVQITDARPDHETFQCTLGIVDMQAGTINAYTGSTVPNKKWMRNYYKIKNNIPTNSRTHCNIMPCGCYIFRVNAHGGGKISPALRMTDPDNLAADANCTVLRTSNDLSYTHEDFWHNTKPYDNIHCAYFDDKFSSAGCQTIKGRDGHGAWGAFQDVIGGLGWNARIDYVLLTGREAAIAAAIIAAGRENDSALVEAALGRMRVGSEGDDVTALQKKLGFRGSGYFGPLTKARLVVAEDNAGLASDGVYAPSDDLATGWKVFRAQEDSADQSADEMLGLRLDGGPEGAAQAVDSELGNAIVVRPLADVATLTLSANALLSVGGVDHPVTLKAEIAGLPAATSGVTIETVFAAVATGEGPTDGTGDAPVVATAAVGAVPKLTAESFDSFAPNARADYRDAMLEHGHNILGARGIDATPRRLAHFLAQIGHESGGFRLRVESLNYTTAKRLTEVWPSRFPTETEAAPFVNNEEALANKVYGERLGNTDPGDGFRYRGRGLIQLTGRSTYAEFGEKLGVDLETNPDLAFEPMTALRIATEYWAGRRRRGERSMNALADDDKLRAITYRINGGFTNFAHRESELARAKALWGDTDSTVIRPSFVERGDFDDKVRELQLLLVEIGALTGTVDGKFGNGTYRALRRFKESNGLNGVGYADDATFAALKREAATGMSAIEAEGPLPRIGEEPEPVRHGISRFDEDVLIG